MSRGVLTNPTNHRDYGATSSSTNAIHSIPDVNFSGFSPTEFMSLSENIAHNINTVKSSWQQLERAFKVIGTNRDTQSTRDKVHHIQAQTNIKIQATSKDLQRLATVVRRGDKQQKLQVEKLTSDFRTVVEKYSTSQQQIATKMKKIFLQSVHAQQQDEESASGVNTMSAADREELIQRQKQLQAGLQFEQDMVLDRETRIREIEADVLDVNEIMRELSSLVHQQGQSIDTIESSIDHTCADVEAGTSELMKAAQYRQRYRRKVLILLVIAVIIGLIVTGIIVSQLKS
ncbi:unnamed protein product [Hermetia illucens]|uniref:t-SNARE coiled-coil homology domain-containing protein n=1 Tax=Hermetia illucens TaxID=343691 RepID=A0A7R8YS92_HERIL|nr:syntaxin-12 [Hermetia illucens]CAD7080324.1 unnamed protein product [Hermetia illucens]